MSLAPIRRRFVGVDLGNLPAPDAVVPPDVEAVIAERKAAIANGIADPDLRAEVAATLALESEPLAKDAEAGAYRELLHYQRVNEAVRGVLLPTARGADLDQLVTRLGVQRQVITPANSNASPPVAAVLESDADLRYRYQLALEAHTTAGSYGGYEFHSRTAHPKVKDVAVYGPESGLVTPGIVRLVVLSRTGTGVPSQEVLDAVFAANNDAETRPLTDLVQVRPATVATYRIHYHLQVRPGADPGLIVMAAHEALTLYAAQSHRVGRRIVDSALDSAAHQDRVNVIRAIRIAPLGLEVDPGPEGAAWCESVVVTYEIVEG